MIISYVQTKGGTGKSTLAMNTAFSRHFSRNFKSIALVELDPQGTLKNWWQERAEVKKDTNQVSFHHISSTQRDVFQDGIQSISANNQIIIMDIPGESTGKLHTRFACAVSDVVIIPMRTSTNDETAFADNLYPTIKEIIKVEPGKKDSFYVLPSFSHPQSKNQTLIDYFEDILPSDIRCLPAVYPTRSVYENFNREGMTLYDYASLVKNNRRFRKQAQSALDDIEEIARTITHILERRNGIAEEEKEVGSQ